MPPIARNHHYLPQFYLAQFTETSAKDGHFFVHGVSNGRTFRTSPKNVAVERDFNRMEIEGERPDIVERILAPFEALAADSIKRVNETQNFPSEKDFGHIINLLCLLAVRNPKQRRKLNAFREEIDQAQLELLVSDVRIFERTIKRAKEAGYLQECDASFLEMKSFIEEKRYSIQYTSEGNVTREFDAFDYLLPVLGRRFWSITIAPPPCPTFVCSDDPVILVFKQGINTKPGMPMGFGMSQTEVFLPLNPRVGFWGVYEDPPPPVTLLSPEAVARKNAYIVFNADRQIYSREKEFMILHKGRMHPFDLEIEFRRRQTRGKKVKEA